MDLTNAAAIVIGGAGGFGPATVRRLAQLGAIVMIAQVSDERGEVPAIQLHIARFSGDAPPGQGLLKRTYSHRT